MTYEQFERFFNALDLYYKRSELLSKGIEPFNGSWTVIEFCNELPDSIFEYLKEVFDDSDGWISWWYWDHKHNPELTATQDGKEIKLDTLKDLYDFLTKGV